MPYALGPGPRIFYEVRGPKHAPTLVLIRGLGRFSDHWGELTDELEGDLRLVLLDNRGVGRSEDAKRPFTTADMAADVARVLDETVEGRAHVFGMSLGGMIAQELAIGWPERVDRLVLGCTSHGGRSAARGRASVLVTLGRARLAGVERAIETEARFILSPAFLAQQPDIVTTWIELAREHPTSRQAMALQVLAAARHDSADRLHKITAPTLIVSGTDDHLIPAENARLLARHVAGAEIAWLEGAGHDFTTERPQESARILRRFLTESV